MQWAGKIEDYFKQIATYRVTMDASDIVEIVIIAVLVYFILSWMKSTRAWTLLKGIIVIAVFLLLADIFNMNTILWMVQNVLSFAVIALIIVLQPELRKALEELGKKNFVSRVIPFEVGKKEAEAQSDKTINEIVKGCVEMGQARTGALIVIEQKESLKDYEITGIQLDAIVTSQLLINIFEHNTPLHDGAVIIRGNRVTYATCYLPLSYNMDISKELGTRHRAGVGISEATDSLTVIVSEQTGHISLALEGKLIRDLNADSLKQKMTEILIGGEGEKTRSKIKWPGRSKA